MSIADPRYYQLWAARPVEKAQQPAQSYRVDIHAPGGVTYAPDDDVATHGARRRLFLPRRSARDDEYDFGHEIAQRIKQEEAREKRRAGRTASCSASIKDKGETARAAFAIGEADEEGNSGSNSPHASDVSRGLADLGLSGSKDQLSDAQKYAAGIDMTPREPSPNDREATASSSSSAASYPRHTAPSIAPSKAPTHRSTMTAYTVARNMELARSEASRLVRKNRPQPPDGDAAVTNFQPPPSVTGESYRSVDPWNAKQFRSRDEFHRITEEEQDRGLTRGEEFVGEGNVPTRLEVEENRQRDAVNADVDDDARTVKSSSTATGTSKRSEGLRISDVFIPDPRPYHPLRLVRRTDPRQVLVLCSSVVMSSKQVASMKAVQKATLDGIQLMKQEQAKELLASFGSDETGDARGGLGVYFCPSDSASSFAPSSDINGDRREPNFSRRMERTAFPYSPTPERAALRSVIAALEYLPYHKEGFDKIVIGVSAARDEWIVRGIAFDLHEWRNNDWKLTRSMWGGKCHPGDVVPDRDLWETLDLVVKGWESVDVSVRFWAVGGTGGSGDEGKRDGGEEELMQAARKLAKEGACKDTQQPQMVKWVKKSLQ